MKKPKITKIKVVPLKKVKIKVETSESVSVSSSEKYKLSVDSNLILKEEEFEREMCEKDQDF